MKKLILVLFLISLIAFPCLSQTDSDTTKVKTNKTYFGIFGGMSRSSLFGNKINSYFVERNGEDIGELIQHNSPTLGLFLKTDFTSILYGKIGFNYLSKGGGVKDNEYFLFEPDVTIKSINFPIQLGVSTSNDHSLRASFEVGLGFNIETSSNKEDLIPTLPSFFTPNPVKFSNPVEFLIGGNIEYNFIDEMAIMLNYRYFTDLNPFYIQVNTGGPREIFMRGGLVTLGIMGKISAP